MDANISEPVDSRVHRVLAGVSRVRVLGVLREQGRALTVAGIAERVGLHPNTVRLHLDHLVLGATLGEDVGVSVGAAAWG